MLILKRLIFFNKPIYKIFGNSILTDFAGNILQKKGLEFHYIKTEKKDFFSLIENFYLPEKLAKFLDLKNRRFISYLLITKNLIIPLSNNYIKFKNRIRNCVTTDEVKLFEETLNLKKVKNISFFEFVKNNFSENFSKILFSILIVYKFFNLEEISLKKGIEIIKDFFSPNYFCSLNILLSDKTFISPVINKRSFVLTDCPDKYKNYEIKVSYTNVKIKENFLPELTIFYYSEPIIIYKKDNFYTFENCEHLNEFEEFYNIFMNKKVELDNLVEKKFVKSYKGLISKNNNYLGKYSVAPYNPYDLLNSVWRFFNEKERYE